MLLNTLHSFAGAFPLYCTTIRHPTMQLQLTVTCKFISDDEHRRSYRPHGFVVVVVVADSASSALTFNFTFAWVGSAVSNIYLANLPFVETIFFFIYLFRAMLFSSSVLIIMNMECTRQCIKTSDDGVFLSCAHCECVSHCRCLLETF